MMDCNSSVCVEKYVGIFMRLSEGVGCQFLDPRYLVSFESQVSLKGALSFRSRVIFPSNIHGKH